MNWPASVGWLVFIAVPGVLWLVGAWANRGHGFAACALAFMVGSDNRLSLSRLQAFAWTLVIFGSFAAAMCIHTPITSATEEKVKPANATAKKAADATAAKKAALQSAQGSTSKLTPVETPTLIIDPACNTCDGGSVVLQLRNDGKEQEELSLTAGPLLNKTTSKSLDAEIILMPVSNLTGKEKSENTAVQPGKFQFVRVEVKNVLEEGDWEAEIRNRGVSTGTFKVVRPQVPFSVSLDDTDLFLQRARKGFLLLKNADAAAYPVTLGTGAAGQEAPSGL